MTRSIATHRPLAALLAVTLLATAAFAVKPKEWVHQTEEDFQEAKVENVVVTNYGTLELARATDQLAALESEDAVIYDIAQTADGTVFVAAGPEGQLFKIVDGKLESVQEFVGEQIFALTPNDKGLWIAVSGVKTRLEHRDAAGEVTKTIALPETRYVWEVIVHENHAWLATGAEGQVLVVDLTAEAPEPVVALDTEQDNVLALALGPDGKVYAGTDGEGLVYRIEKTGGEPAYRPFVIYDANEPEIGAILVDDAGIVYVGTSDADGAKPGRMDGPAKEEKGTPDESVEQEPAEGEAAPEQADAPAEAEEGPQPPVEAPAEADEPAQPTAEQYDKLREAIKARLAEAKEKGGIAVASNGGGSTVASQTGSGGKGKAASKGGNAVYRIDKDGFVREVFRESVMILRLAFVNGDLIVATGNEGQLYSVDIDKQEVALLTKLDVQQLPALARLADGSVVLGTANPGRLYTLGTGYADEGTLTSGTLDASQISLWGRLRVAAAAPDNAGIKVQTRSGNIEDPEKGPWSPWSAPRVVNPDAPHLPVAVPVDAPPARFLQYRITLTGQAEVTPHVGSVSLKYLTPNLRPRIDSIQTEYDKPKSDDGPAPATKLKVSWEASDPNEDALSYTLEARKLTGEGETPFVPVVEDHAKNNFEWDTRRTADGRYELRVVATDAPDNVPGQIMKAARRSAIVVIDNTPPELKNLRLTPAGPGAVRVTGTAADALSEIAEVRYSVAGEDEWKIILPADMIYDSTSESIAFTISDLPSGSQTITVRATDELGNSRYASQTVRVAK